MRARGAFDALSMNPVPDPTRGCLGSATAGPALPRRRVRDGGDGVLLGLLTTAVAKAAVARPTARFRSRLKPKP